MIMWVVMGFSSHFATRIFGDNASNWMGDPHVIILLSLLALNGVCRAVVQPAKQIAVADAGAQRAFCQCDHLECIAF